MASKKSLFSSLLFSSLFSILYPLSRRRSQISNLESQRRSRLALQVVAAAAASTDVMLSAGKHAIVVANARPVQH